MTTMDRRTIHHRAAVLLGAVLTSAVGAAAAQDDLAPGQAHVAGSAKRGP